MMLEPPVQLASVSISVNAGKVGACVGLSVGACVGLVVGTCVGFNVGLSVGACVGLSVGLTVGFSVGLTVGLTVGLQVAERGTMASRMGSCIGDVRNSIGGRGRDILHKGTS